MSRTLARLLIAVALTLISSFALVGVAHAETTCGYAGQPSCLPATANKSSVRGGGTVSGTAGPVQSGETGSILLVGPSGTLTIGTYNADAAGIIRYSVVIPTGLIAGSYTLNFPGHLPTGAEVTYFVPITITGSGSGSGSGVGDGLPFTGAEIGIASAVGAGLLAVGTIAVVSARRRRETATA